MNSNCYLCGSKNIELLHKGTRDNKNIDVLKCPECNLVFLSSFDHIENGFYEGSGMHDNGRIDIVTWRNNTYEDDARRSDLLKECITDKDVLDFGCGNGGFLQCSEKYTKRVCGIEIERAARQELNEHGYTVWEDIEQCDQKFDIITMFHVLEHLPDPIVLLKKLSSKLKDNKQSQLIIETPNSEDALLSLYQSKEFADFTYWSPHLLLYSQENINILAKKAELKVKWVKQVQRYPLANHLHWLSVGLPGGHKKWDFMNDPILTARYEKVLQEKQMCDTLLFSLELE
jgi:2-polyprenyl-3-methyl-5-hydroxy-6-metoxy-1,4-benzoquinol methylase